MFETTRRDDVCRLAHPDARWLATGWDGGFVTAEDALNISVPDGFDRTDLSTYVMRRRDRADLPGNGPALLTGVDMGHARAARAGSVTVVATVGLSNPATLPLDPPPTSTAVAVPDEPGPGTGTVNLLVGTTRALDDGTLASLLATAVEAKAATLETLVGFSGTTTDAVVVGGNPAGDPVAFAGSGTALGTATRACVRDAITASFESRYDGTDVPRSVSGAAHGRVTKQTADVFRPPEAE